MFILVAIGLAIGLSLAILFPRVMYRAGVIFWKGAAVLVLLTFAYVVLRMVMHV